MSNIPLPALALRNDAPSPLNTMAQMMQLQAMKQNQQMNAEQMKAAQLENQQRQQQMQDQQTVMQVLGQTNGDVEKAIPQLAGKVAPQTLMGLQKMHLEAREKLANISDKELATEKYRNDQYTQLLNTAKGMTPEQYAQNWPMLAAQSNRIHPEYQLDPSKPVPQEQLSALGIGLMTSEQYYKAEENRRAQEKQNAELPKIQADAKIAQQDAVMSPMERSLKNQNALEYYAAKGDPMAQAALQKKIDVAKASRPVINTGSTVPNGTATGDAFLQTLPPGIQSQVKAMANGDIAVPPPGTRSPQAQQLRTAVMQYDPTYTDARYKGKQNFKTSGDAQNIVQLSTAMEHANRALLNSGKIGWAPMVGNKTLESSDSARYMQDVEFMTGEVGKLVKNGVLTMDEANKISNGLTAARQDVRDAALHETMDLLGGKTRAMFQKYKISTGQDIPINEFFDSESQKRLVRFGLVDTPASSNGGGAPAPTVNTSGQVQVTDPRGVVHTFPNQKAADIFKRIAGIK